MIKSLLKVGDTIRIMVPGGEFVNGATPASTGVLSPGSKVVAKVQADNTGRLYIYFEDGTSTFAKNCMVPIELDGLNFHTFDAINVRLKTKEMLLKEGWKEEKSQLQKEGQPYDITKSKQELLGKLVNVHIIMNTNGYINFCIVGKSNSNRITYEMIEKISIKPVKLRTWKQTINGSTPIVFGDDGRMLLNGIQIDSSDVYNLYKMLHESYKSVQ